MSSSSKEPQRISIDLPIEIADGVYANLVTVAHSNTEFVVDFIRYMPGVSKARVKARIILTPEHAKRFLAVLTENIRKYEEQFGAIKEPEKNDPYLSFGGNIGEA